ncbi:MAG: HTH domain-containing protein, partial [Chloroflexi bacterium]
MPPSLGRIHGLLLLSDEPISLDEIAAKLGVSKTGASVVTRDLERVGAAR